MIITFLNLKGGVGKTTLAVHIASTLALAQKKVILIDADTQNSALRWFQSRKQDPILPVASIPTSTLHKQIKLIEKDYDFIIIDGPPRLSNVAKSCLVAANLVIIPINPSPYDVWSSSEIIKIIEEVESFKDIKVAFVVNRIIKNSVIGRDVFDIIESYKIPVLETKIHQRVAFAETAAIGTTVIEEDPTSKAGEEIKKLTEEIVNFIKKKEGDKI